LKLKLSSIKRFLRNSPFSASSKMKTDNVTYHKDYIEVELSPKVYSVDTVFSASYVLMDRAYIIIDGDPKRKLMVRLRPKKKYSLKDLAHEFNDELLNYSVYDAQCRRNSRLREELLKRALFTNLSPSKKARVETKHKRSDETRETLVPWEEKYRNES